MKKSILLIIYLCLSQYNNIFGWAERKHAPSELLVHNLLICEDYVFCGTRANWGTNRFGLFVFNRRSETWENYCIGNGLNTNSIIKIERNGDYVNIFTLQDHILFDLNTGKATINKKLYSYDKQWPQEYTLKNGKNIYKIISDSIIVINETKESVYVPSKSSNIYLNKKMDSQQSYYYFSHPILYDNKIYFIYNISEYYDSISEGIGIFNLYNNLFSFYPSSIILNDVTDTYIYNNSIICSTARIPYEGNAGPANGLIEFNLIDLCFKKWKKLPLPNYPIGILCIQQDDSEYWIGTDKGVFRINKENMKCTHYGIKNAKILKDETNVHSYISYDKTTPYPVVMQFEKNEKIEIIGILNEWCEISLKEPFSGYISSSYTNLNPRRGISKTLSIKSENELNVNQIYIKSSKNVESNTLLILDHFENIPNNKYKIIEDNRKIGWFKIEIPTGWIKMDKISFLMEKIR